MNIIDATTRVEGMLTLDVTDPATGQTMRLQTAAPFAKVEMDTEYLYERPDYPSPSVPEMLGVDLTLHVRMLREDAAADGVLYRQVFTPPAETTEQVIRRVIDDTAAVDVGTQRNADALAAELVDALRKAGRL